MFLEEGADLLLRLEEGGASTAMNAGSQEEQKKSPINGSIFGGVKMTDILIVEDEPAILDSLSFILGRNGWTVASARDGDLALEAVRRLKPRMLLLDIMLPKKSGLDVLKAIRADPGMTKTAVVVLTARGQQYDRELAAELNADGFITKPYANTDVVAEVRRMLALHHA